MRTTRSPLTDGMSRARRPERWLTSAVELDQAANLLSDKVLDAAIDEGGQIQFALGQQA